ncbi:MAG TPA: hypothetical protein DDZ96_04330 [Porphyromonadaceae bacterium]|jgi:hypothetical protein|nr:hypothetical protein [Porphyromonadaceae bacterium]HBK32345.1 hypothetical protein [Porphyromonadaceae bacterium]HBL33031.1 hypothetical protein [Porphyromonadaceae bacterium]HCM19951.1 hypothetical protein [Porphyromonadaceae bacterium]
MKTTTFTLTFITVLLTLTVFAAQAQEGLKIQSVFEKYGKQKGATMVVLSGEALHDYRLDKYRSITIEYDKAILNDIQHCLQADKKQAREIKEVISNGIISSGYYQLPAKEDRIHRYILFKMAGDGTATLIYMEGGPESEALINRLFIKRK